MTDHIIQQVEQQVKQTHTRQLDISFNELADMYQNDELNIRPSFQRLFRWSEEQQSRFIESLILEMPVPPIFVIEIEDGRYELIDGLQRISSYLNFRGLLKEIEKDDTDLENDEAGEQQEEKTVLQETPKTSLTLIGCDIADLLNGLTYDMLPTTFQIRLKRSFIRMQVIRKESNKMLRYHMFKRLNTGGEKLEPQEIRNCNIRILDDKFADFLKKITQDENFQGTVKTTDEKMKSAYLEELALRFFAYKNYREEYKKDIEPFLDDYMERVSLPVENERYLTFNFEEEKKEFEKVFSILNAALGSRSFGVKNKSSDGISEAFRIYHFESITQGILSVLNKIDASDNNHIDKVKVTLTAIKGEDAFIKLTTGGGKNSRNQLNDRIEYVENKFVEAFGND